MTDIGPKLAMLAESIADEAMAQPFEDRLDAFKCLTNYYCGIKKIKAAPAEVTDGDSFDHYAKLVEDATGGGGGDDGE